MSLGLAELAQRRRQTQKSSSRHYVTPEAVFSRLSSVVYVRRAN